jgi:error-prone DNA polymerase
MSRISPAARISIAAVSGCSQMRTPSTRWPARRAALWQAVGAVPDENLLRGAAIDDETATLPAPAEAQEIVGDYRSPGLTLNRHPLALLHSKLATKRFVSASELVAYRNGQLAAPLAS